MSNSGSVHSSPHSARYSPCPGAAEINTSESNNAFSGSQQALVEQFISPSTEGFEAIAEADLRNLTLHMCARNGEAGLLARLLTDKHTAKHVDDPDDSGMNPLHYAARFNHYKCAKALIEIANADVAPEDKEGATPLHYAARKKQKGASEDTESLIMLLVEKGADVNAKTKYGSTPLHFASMRGNETVTEALLKCEKIDVNARDLLQATPLHEAATYNQLAEARLLIKANCDVYVKDNEEITPLHLAAITENAELCSLLIESVPEESKKKFVNELDLDCNTALHFAIENRSVMSVQVLIEQGASVDGYCRPKTSNSTALHLAAITGNAQTIRLLIDNGASLMDIDSSRSTPLHKAVEYQNYEAVKILVEANKDCIKQRDDEEYTPLLIAACYEAPKIVKELLNKGADILNTDHREKSVLHLAADYNQYRVLRVLLKHLEGLEDKQLINSTDRSGNTAIHIAASKGHDEVVRYLSRYPGIELDIKNEDEETAFHSAAQAGHAKICDILLKKTKCKCLNDEDEDSNTALHMASKEGHLSVVQLLIKNGADKEARNCDQQTPLDFAAEMGHLEIVKLLLDCDVPVDPTDKFERKTPLHLAARNGHANVIRTLIENGADITITDKAGKNALDIAIDSGHVEAATAIVKSPKWRESLISVEGSTKDLSFLKEGDREKKRLKIQNKHITPMRKLIKHMPDVAQIVFDQCIVRGPENARHDEEDFWVEFNFEFLDDTLSHWKSETGEENQKEQSVLYDVHGIPFRSMTPYNSNSSYLKDNHPLMLLVRYKQESLLNHPLVLALIGHKWRVANYFYMAFLLFYATFLALFSAFVIDATPPYLVNATACAADNSYDSVFTSAFNDVVKFPIIILACIGILIEVFQIIAIKTKYFGQWINILDWFTYVSAILVVLDFKTCGTQTNWQWQLSAFGVFTAWIDLLLFLRRFPKLGIYVVMVVEILRTFLRFFVIFFLFIVAFGISFYILLQNQAAFRDPFNAIVKTWVMMIGEMDYGDIFNAHVTEGDEDPFNRLYFGGSTYAIFVVFLVVMTIIIMNLLTGLAVDDVNELQEHAQLKKLSMQIDLALDVEIACPTIVKTWWHCIIGKYRVYPNLERTTCGEIMIYIEEAIQGPLAKSRYVQAAVLGKMADAGDDEDPKLVELENRISRKVENNSKQLQGIDERLETLERLLRGYIDEQRGAAHGDTETEPE